MFVYKHIAIVNKSFIYRVKSMKSLSTIKQYFLSHLEIVKDATKDILR